MGDCQAAFENWNDAWSDAQKDWCCTHQRLGCAESSISEVGVDGFDCQQGLYNWEMEWTDDKKVWCCDKLHLGCLAKSHASAFGYGTIVTLLILGGSAVAAWYW